MNIFVFAIICGISIIYVDGNSIRSKDSVNCGQLCKPGEGLQDSCKKYCSDYESQLREPPGSQPKDLAPKTPEKDSAKSFHWIIIGVIVAVCVFVSIAGIIYRFRVSLNRFRENICKRQEPENSGAGNSLLSPIQAVDNGPTKLAIETRDQMRLAPVNGTSCE